MKSLRILISLAMLAPLKWLAAGLRITEDSGWMTHRWLIDRAIDVNVRWPLVWTLLVWISRLLPDTPAGRQTGRALLALHRDCLPVVVAETKANNARIEYFARAHRRRKRAA